MADASPVFLPAILGLAACLALLPPASADGLVIDSGEIAPGGSWSYTFWADVMYHYHCHPHPFMTGTLTVGFSDGANPSNHTVRIVEGSPADSSTWRFAPADLVIKAGDTVTWVNEGSVNHTATQEGGHHHGGEHDPPADHNSHDAPFQGAILALAAAVLALSIARTRRT